jgi:hypothetical protein
MPTVFGAFTGRPPPSWNARKVERRSGSTDDTYG